MPFACGRTATLATALATSSVELLDDFRLTVQGSE